MKYTVYYKSISEVFLEVEADSAEEAEAIAEKTDGGSFIETGEYDWIHTRTERNLNS